MAISKGDFEGANLVGGPFKDYVNDQVKVRQDILGKLNKDSSDIVWENGKSAFLALGSSVNIENFKYSNSADVDAYKIAKSIAAFGGTTLPTEVKLVEATQNVGNKRINDLDLPGTPENYMGNYLARNMVLFGGASYYNDLNPSNNPDIGANPGDLGSVNMRSGLANQSTIINNSAYGLGGTEQGLSAMPGITSFNIKSRNMGSLREATVSIRANNEKQFQMIDSLYCRIGYSMFLEWGNTSYYDNKKSYKSGNASTSLMSTFLQGYYYKGSDKVNLLSKPTSFLDLIEGRKKSTSSNYDAFFGRVKNFSWEFNKEGYWEITLSLISWGDIIESLTIDSLYGVEKNDFVSPQFPQGNTLSSLTQFLTIAAEPHIQYHSPGASADKGSIYDYLQGVPKQHLVSWVKDGRKESDTDSRIDYTRLKSSQGKIISNHAIFVNKHYFYIRFGDILDFIRDKLLLYVKDGEEAIVDIDTDTNTNMCYNPGVNVSADPSKVMINAKLPLNENQLRYQANRIVGGKKVWNAPIQSSSVFGSLKSGMLEEFTSTTHPSKPKNQTFPLHGKIMNIYFEYQYLLDTIQNLRDENTTTIPLYDFINKLLETANSCLGGVNKLSIRLEEDRILRIYDQNQIPGTQNDEGNVINLYGILPSNVNKTILNQGSFVTDFNIKTELTNEFSTTVAIGAQAQGKTIGEDATGLSTWNYGLVDRYYPEKIDSLRKGTSSKKLTTSQRIEKTRDQLKYLWLGYAEGSIGDINDIDFPDGYIPFGNSSFINAEDQYIFPNFPTKRYDQFVKLQKDWLKELLKLENEIANRERILNNERTFGTNQIGMIPINISVTMDGISGIRIYDRLKVDTRFLPNYYPQTLLWVIKGVSHEIQNNKWYTKLETIAVPKITESEDFRTMLSDPNQSSTVSIPGGDKFTGLTPNADILRIVLKKLQYGEKIKFNEGEKGELTSNGDMNASTVNIAIKFFELLWINNFFAINVTGGNDYYHTSVQKKFSFHRTGQAIDFTMANQDGSDPSLPLQKKITELGKQVMYGTPGFKFGNEYKDPSSGATGGHFHFSYVEGNPQVAKPSNFKLKVIRLTNN